MKLNSINSTPFAASIKRETYLDRKGNERQYSQRQIEKSFDDAIKYLQSQKEAVSELDTFMQSKEVKEALKKLPAYDRVTIYTYKHPEEIFFEPILEYSGGSMNDEFTHPETVEKLYEISGFEAVNEKGKVDKKGILNWLEQIRQILNQ